MKSLRRSESTLNCRSGDIRGVIKIFKFRDLRMFNFHICFSVMLVYMSVVYVDFDR